MGGLVNVIPTGCLQEKVFQPMCIFKTVFSANIPIVITRHEIHAAGVIFHAFNLRIEALFSNITQKGCFRRQAVRIHNIAQYHKRDPFSELLEMVAHKGEDRIGIIGFRRAGITDEQHSMLYFIRFNWPVIAAYCLVLLAVPRIFFPGFFQCQAAELLKFCTCPIRLFVSHLTVSC